MFGYATDETEECMPLTVVLAHKLNARMAELRRNGTLPWLRPDSKTQVALSYLLVASTDDLCVFVYIYTYIFFPPLVTGYCAVPPGPWCHAPSACAHYCDLSSA